MATQIYQVTDSPVNLNGADDIEGNAITLTAGETYVGRYISTGYAYDFLKTVEAATAPDAADPGLPVYHKEDMAIIPVAGEGIYVWNTRGVGRIIVNEGS